MERIEYKEDVECKLQAIAVIGNDSGASLQGCDTKKEQTECCSIKSQAWKNKNSRQDAEALTSVTGRVGDTSYAFSHRIRCTAEEALRALSAWWFKQKRV